MKENQLLVWVIVILLLFIDFLTFHDFGEVHTLRDWLTLLASILVFCYFFKGPKK